MFLNKLFLTQVYIHPAPLPSPPPLPPAKSVQKSGVKKSHSVAPPSVSGDANISFILLIQPQQEADMMLG